MKRYRFSQKTFNCIWILFILFVVVLMAISVGNVRQAAYLRQEVQSRRMLCAELRRELEDASDYLTEQARSYVITGNPDDMADYWEEIHTGKRREAVMGQLGGIGLSEDGTRLLQAAKTNSDLLVYLETRAMRLAAESRQAEAAGLPDEVRDYVLNVVERSMSPEQKYLQAVELLFGSQYTAEKAVIGQYTTQFLEAAEAELDQELERAEHGSTRAMRFQWGLQAAAVICFLLALVVCYYMTINPALHYHNCLIQGREEELHPGGILEVRILGESIRAMYQNMRDALKTKDEFLASVSHEIRTPLYSIMGYQTLLEQTKLTDDQKEYLIYMKRASAHLLEMVTHLLDYEKLENQEAKPVNRQWEPKELAEYLDTGFRHLAETEKLDFQVHLKDDVPRLLYGDVSMIRQIGANLVSNAIKFTDTGSIQITIGWEEDSSAAGTLILAVQDTGSGIKDKDMERIFSPFEQAGMATGKRYAGTGLGLSICRRLAYGMGGTVSAVSMWGEGSTFTAKIPQNVPKREEEQTAMFRESMKGHVLLAEDNRVNQYMQKQLLELLGVSVQLACNGKEAVALAEKESFDMIFMDLRMPDLDGYEAAAQIREREQERQSEDGKYRRVPMIALTADGDGGTRDRALEAGMDGFLVKPADIRQLQRVLGQYLEDKPSSSEWDSLETQDSMTEAVRRDGLDRQVARLYCQGHPADFQKLFDLNKAGQMEEMKEILHMLKGASAVAGADQVKELCASLEKKLKEAVPVKEEIEPDILELKTAFEEFKKRQGEESQGKALDADSHSHPLEKQVMEEWNYMVRDGAFEALDMWREHQAAFTEFLGAERARTIERALESYQYQDVLMILESL